VELEKDKQDSLELQKEAGGAEPEGAAPLPESSITRVTPGSQIEEIKTVAEQAEQQRIHEVKQSEFDPSKQQHQPSGGKKRVAENSREGVYESFNKMSESVFSLEGVKKAAAWYIETSEKLATQALELQERATGWAKDTPFAPLFEAQHSFARKMVERSAHAARTLWQIPANMS
jgi:hypothetical protein